MLWTECLISGYHNIKLYDVIGQSLPFIFSYSILLIDAFLCPNLLWYGSSLGCALPLILFMTAMQSCYIYLCISVLEFKFST